MAELKLNLKIYQTRTKCCDWTKKLNSKFRVWTRNCMTKLKNSCLHLKINDWTRIFGTELVTELKMSCLNSNFREPRILSLNLKNIYYISNTETDVNVASGGFKYTSIRLCTPRTRLTTKGKKSRINIYIKSAASKRCINII